MERRFDDHRRLDPGNATKLHPLSGCNCTQRLMPKGGPSTWQLPAFPNLLAWELYTAPNATAKSIEHKFTI